MKLIIYLPKQRPFAPAQIGKKLPFIRSDEFDGLHVLYGRSMDVEEFNTAAAALFHGDGYKMLPSNVRACVRVVDVVETFIEDDDWFLEMARRIGANELDCTDIDKDWILATAARIQSFAAGQTLLPPPLQPQEPVKKRGRPAKPKE